MGRNRTIQLRTRFFMGSLGDWQKLTSALKEVPLEGSSTKISVRILQGGVSFD